MRNQQLEAFHSFKNNIYKDIIPLLKDEMEVTELKEKIIARGILPFQKILYNRRKLSEFSDKIK